MNETARAETFGRVADDGTVYVRTPTGERVVGSWQAGSAAAGLAHYARRYDDLVTEIDLLAARLASGSADVERTLVSARRISDSLPDAAVVGDLEALTTRVAAVIEQAQRASEQARVARSAARQQAIARKQELVAEAEQLSTESTQWKAAGDRLREIVDEWKTIKGVDRKTDTYLWRQYAAARDAFGRRRGGHFATLDAARKQAQTRKDELVAQAEALADSTDWAGTGAQLKNLMIEWKGLPRATREAEDQLWTRFRAAMDRFFGQRTAAFAERDAELVDNQHKKEELLAQAEGLDLGDARKAQDRFRELTARWDEIGRVPRETMAMLDRRLRTVSDRIRDAVSAEWQRSSAANNPLLAQMREQVARAEQQVARARADGDANRLADAERALAHKRQFLDLAEGSQ